MLPLPAGEGWGEGSVFICVPLPLSPSPWEGGRGDHIYQRDCLNISITTGLVSGYSPVLDIFLYQLLYL